jgi:hypothetical protein
MLGVKRLVRPGFVIAVVGHVGLLLALLLVGTGGANRSVPPEPITVELVSSDQVEGTPLDSTSRGSELSSDSKTGSASTAPPRPKMEVPSPQESQVRMNAQGGGNPEGASSQAAPPAEGETPPLPSQALVPPATSADQPEPHPETPKPPNANPGEMFAMPLVLPGGQVGSGLDAAASNPAMLPHDDTAAFRARLGSCSKLPAWVGTNNNAAILLRVSFKRDATLASPPQVLRSSMTADAVALASSAIDALQRCQPFTELPTDKYAQWKTLELVVTPLTLSGR